MCAYVYIRVCVCVCVRVCACILQIHAQDDVDILFEMARELNGYVRNTSVHMQTSPRLGNADIKFKPDCAKGIRTSSLRGVYRFTGFSKPICTNWSLSSHEFLSGGRPTHFTCSSPRVLCV